MRVWESSTFWNSALALAAYIGGNALGVPVPWELAASMVGAYAIKEGARYTADAKVDVSRAQIAAWPGNPMRPRPKPGDAVDTRLLQMQELRRQLDELERGLPKEED